MIYSYVHAIDFESLLGYSHLKKQHFKIEI